MKTYTLIKEDTKRPRYKLDMDSLEASLRDRISAFLDIKLATIKIRNDE